MSDGSSTGSADEPAAIAPDPRPPATDAPPVGAAAAQRSSLAGPARPLSRALGSASVRLGLAGAVAVVLLGLVALSIGSGPLSGPPATPGSPASTSLNAPAQLSRTHHRVARGAQPVGRHRGGHRAGQATFVAARGQGFGAGRGGKAATSPGQRRTGARRPASPRRRPTAGGHHTPAHKPAAPKTPTTPAAPTAPTGTTPTTTPPATTAPTTTQGPTLVAATPTPSQPDRSGHHHTDGRRTASDGHRTTGSQAPDGSPGHHEHGHPGGPPDDGQGGDDGSQGPAGHPGHEHHGHDPAGDGGAGDPNGPGDSGNPGSHGNPAGDPGNSGDPGGHGNPGDSGGHGNPGNPGNPGDPGGHGNPGNPGGPGDPSQHGDPGEHGNPSDPGGPPSSHGHGGPGH